MPALQFIRNLPAALRWKGRQLYSQSRCWLGGGEFIWTVSDDIQFVASSDQPFSHVVFVCRGHEVVEMNWCRQWLRRGDSIIDCGANIGYFSAWLAQACALERIVAVEGNTRTAERCAKNFQLLGLNNTRLVGAVLSSGSGERLFIPDAPGREPWQRVKAATAETAVPTLSLDELAKQHLPRPNLVKIDCEGFEPNILRGSERLLRDARPAWVIECNDPALAASGAGRRELFALLRRHNYRLFHLHSFAGFYPLGEEVTDDFPPKEFNFAAIPNDPHSQARWEASIQAPHCIP